MRVLLALAILAIVFAPALLSEPDVHEPSPQLVAAAVLAPADDEASIPAARARSAVDAFALAAIIAVALVLDVGMARWRSETCISCSLPRHRSQPIRRRGPPALVA